MKNRKTDNSRAFAGFVAAVLAGWLIGILIRQVRVGLVIGLALGLVSSIWLRRR